ncbi:SatD family protein [Nonlabens marinus]|uniref:SatD n=1 Tax=Nonlabens marinus S1-08 TaxID=1454201 RepID=W8VWS0_9FLAO|nr:SatD family protein [Nonlabens marinus]BAO56573.1 hypothetical protein NMS_2564 [Nonlabens marinus S1-08]
MEVVIAGDIVNSQQNNPDEYLTVLKSVLSEYSQDGMFQIYRGDSFQAVLNRPQLGLYAALKLKTALKRLSSLDVRVAIGLGDVNIIENNVAISTGNALTRSGELLDSLKNKEQNIMVRSDHKLDNYMNAVLKMALLYMDDWTENSASVVYELLDNPSLTQEELGKKLGIQQSTASRRLNRANWQETQELYGLFHQYYNDVNHDASHTR